MNIEIDTASTTGGEARYNGKPSTAEIAAADPPIVIAPPPPARAPQAPPAEVDWEKVRADFPILSRTVHGKPLVYLDSTATSQKPQVVLDAMDDYYSTTNANIHRGVYELSEVATDRYEKARARIARFSGAKSSREIIYTRSATEATNLAA